MLLNQVADGEHARHAGHPVPRRTARYFLACAKLSRWHRQNQVVAGVPRTQEQVNSRRKPPEGQRIRRILTGSLTSHTLISRDSSRPACLG